MPKWTHIVVVHEDDFPLFSVWGSGTCSVCRNQIISVKATLKDGIFRLAEKNIPGVKYGTIIKAKEFYTRESGQDHNCRNMTKDN